MPEARRREDGEDGDDERLPSGELLPSGWTRLTKELSGEGGGCAA